MNDLPAPPVPADCDLRDLQWMPLDVARLRDSELAAVPDAEVFRCAVLSWCASWHQVPAGSLPDDDATLARLLGYGRDVKGWKKIRAAGGLRGWSLCSDGRLYHPVVATKAAEAAAQKQSAKRKRERDAKRLADWRSSRDETHSETRFNASDETPHETRFVAERQDRTRQDLTLPKREGESPHPPVDQKVKNREALAKALRRWGLPTSPEAVIEWGDMLLGRGQCQGIEEVLEGIQWIIGYAKREGVQLTYAKNSVSYADLWAVKLSRRRALPVAEVAP